MLLNTNIYASLMYINRDSIYSQRNKISLQVKSLFKGDI